jgi:hypothetical protein
LSSNNDLFLAKQLLKRFASTIRERKDPIEPATRIYIATCRMPTSLSEAGLVIARLPWGNEAGQAEALGRLAFRTMISFFPSMSPKANSISACIPLPWLFVVVLLPAWVSFHPETAWPLVSRPTRPPNLCSAATSGENLPEFENARAAPLSSMP